MYQPTKKVISLIYLGTSALAWLFFQHLVTFIWVTANISFGRTWTVPLPMFVGILMSIALFVFLFKNEKITEFIEGVIVELSRVAWPARKETVLSTGVVSILIGICAFILFGFDMFWGAMVRIFYQ